MKAQAGVHGISILSVIIITLGCTEPRASDFAYLGQKAPLETPEVFAPGIVSTGGHETDVTFTPDLTEIYFTRTGTDWYSVIYVVAYREGSWSYPIPVSFSGDTSKNYPFVSPDGRVMYFDSAGGTGNAADRDLWFVRREGDAWRDAKRLGPVINTRSTESFAGVTLSGTMYFCSRREDTIGQMDIYRSAQSKHGYAEPENLGRAINSEYNDFHPYVDPEERYVIFDSQRGGGYGANDLYISFRQPDGSWAEATNLGEQVNSPAADMRPCVSPDGKFLFFCSTRGGDQDIYWINAEALGLNR